MYRFVTAMAGVTLAGLLWMAPVPADTTSGFEPPPSEGALLLSALGDRRVAADLGWIGLVQRVGTGRYIAAGVPHLEGWADVTTRMDPRFEGVYFLTAAFLTAVPDRADALDALLARGEAALPESGTLSMARGMVHYFGRYEPALAASHFRTAILRGGVPPYLESFAIRLERLAENCRAMGEDLAAFQVSAGGTDSAQAREVAVECSKRVIERGAAAWRLRTGGDPTFEELRDAGELRGVVQFPGRCWRLAGGVALLEECP